jgi:hypothetical protein
MLVSSNLVVSLKEINEKVDKCIYLVSINGVVVGSCNINTWVGIRSSCLTSRNPSQYPA